MRIVHKLYIRKEEGFCHILPSVLSGNTKYTQYRLLQVRNRYNKELESVLDFFMKTFCLYVLSL